MLSIQSKIVHEEWILWIFPGLGTESWHHLHMPCAREATDGMEPALEVTRVRDEIMSQLPVQKSSLA